MATRTGYKIIVYLDDNPLSPTYMETYEEKVQDETTCPIAQDDLVLVSNECEVTLTGYTGYRLLIYYNRATGEYSEVREADSECEASSSDEQWVNSGSPYCETTEKGVNTGYMLQLQVQSNPQLENYGATRTARYKSPDCLSNACAIWDDIQKQCHISVIDCVATFDGTADITQIDINPLSDTYNQTRTANKEDSDCENCTNTVFSWVLVGDMCGDDELLCSNGLQQTSTNSYTVSQKYKTIGNGTPVPMDEYQIVLKTEDDEDCGYIRPQYKMEKAAGEYLCDFETYTKYEMMVRMVSYDAGITWSVWHDKETGEIYTERGEVIAYDSYDCGKPLYRWVFNGEYICLDNGDDGKFIYWDSNGQMTKRQDCSDSDVLTSTEMTNVTDGMYSKDGYTDTYQVGDCVRVIGTGMPSVKLWLGNYTEQIGTRTLVSYNRASLDIPERVNDMDNLPFGSTYYAGSCWDSEGPREDFRTLIMHPATPPQMDDSDLPPMFVNGNGEWDSAGGRSAIFVPAESYDSYCEMLPSHVGSNIGRLLPMNNDNEPYKAIMRYKSDFTEFSWFVPLGASGTVIDGGEIIYGKGIVTSITIADTVKEIKDYAFGDAAAGYGQADKFEQLNLGYGVETIGSYAFGRHRLKQLHIPGNVKTIGDGAFEQNDLYSTLTSLTIDEGVETIGYYAFRYHNLATITIPDSVKTIGKEAFYTSYGNIDHIVIGSGCTSIGDMAFRVYTYNSVKTITVKALTPPSGVGSYTFRTDANTIVYVPCEAYVDYLESSWNVFNLEPYGCSGEEVAIAVLYQTDGTEVEITRPIEYRRKILKESDIASYSSTTSAITVTTACTEFAIASIYSYSAVTRLDFDSVIPPELTNIRYSRRFVNDNQLIYVPCEGYDVYYYIMYDNLSNWNDYDKLISVPSSCSHTYQWVKYSDYCDISEGKLIDSERRYVIIDGESYPTIDTRTVTSDTVCFEITNNDGVSVEWSSMSYTQTYGQTGGTVDFKYLVEGGVDVTLSVTNSGKPYYYTSIDVDVYDGDTLVASKHGTGYGTEAHLESFKQYHLVFTAIRNLGGSGSITFKNI